MLSLEEISDRLEIQQLLIDYSTAIDNKRFDDLDAVFTPDAYIDYSVTGGIEGNFAEVKAWLKEVLPNFPAYYHMLGNVDIRISLIRPATPRPRGRSVSTRWPWAVTSPRSISSASGTSTSSSAPSRAGG